MIIYTDGSCKGNGKANSSGGYGVIILDDNENYLTSYSHSELTTTNNIQEIKAILYSFLNFGKLIDNAKQGFNSDIPIVYSDSAYCVNTFNTWMFNWARNGWLKSNKKPPENLELIKSYYDWWQKGYRIELRKVKGHNGNKWNEIADQLATGAITPEELDAKYLK